MKSTQKFSTYNLFYHDFTLLHLRGQHLSPGTLQSTGVILKTKGLSFYTPFNEKQGLNKSSICQAVMLSRKMAITTKEKIRKLGHTLSPTFLSPELKQEKSPEVYTMVYTKPRACLESILPLIDKVNDRLFNQQKRSKVFPRQRHKSRAAIAEGPGPLACHATFPGKRSFYKKSQIATVSILSTKNNSLLTLSGARGRVLKGGWASAGSLGFRNSRKSTTYASQAAAKQLALRARRQGIRALNLKLQGMGRSKSAIVRTLQKSSLRILVIRESTSLVYNGCRRPKKRRI